jgi:hypothetical protein
MFVVLKDPGVETLITFTTTELEVDEHPAGVVIVKLYVPEVDVIYVEDVAPDITPLASLHS